MFENNMFWNYYPCKPQSDWYQYCDVIKRQIVMGDKVRLMLNSIWTHFLNVDQTPTNTYIVFKLSEATPAPLRLLLINEVNCDKKRWVTYNKIIHYTKTNPSIGLPLTRAPMFTLAPAPVLLCVVMCVLSNASILWPGCHICSHLILALALALTSDGSKITNH